VDAFWTNKVGGGATELTAQQRRTLRGSQFNEFRQRYAGVRRGQSELILIQTRQQQQQLSPSPSSSSYSSRPTKGSPWPMTDNNIQRPEIVGCAGIQVSPIPDGNLDGPTIARAPLMANVAVSQKYRRRGIAQRIVKEVERICKYEWGYNDVYLYVEERNKAALRLYQKLGYRKVWTDDDAQTLLPTSNGRLENAPTRIVCMRKRLDLGLLGRFIPL
jgi:ribosomal protein S18 acetylase RimI-like enzyme